MIEPITREDLIEKSGLSRSTVYRALKDFKELRIIKKTFCGIPLSDDIRAVIKLNDDFKKVQTLSDKREKEIESEHAKIREQHAASIVKMLNKEKKLSPEDTEAQVKQWIEKVDAEGSPENLELLESTLRQALPKSEGSDSLAQAGGPYGIPELTGDIDSEKIPKNSSIMAKTTGRKF